VPTHVVATFGSALLYGPAPDNLQAEAEAIQELLGDVTVMRVEHGPLARRCGPPLLGYGPFDDRLAAGIDATLVSINKDGTLRGRQVVIRQVGFVSLAIEPRREPLQQGLSGSLVVLGDEAVGMLQTVGADGAGRAVRLERVAALLRDYFESNKPPAQEDGAPTETDCERSSSAIQGVSVVSWEHAEAISPEYRIGNLLDCDDRTAWIAKVERLPIEVDLEFPGDEPLTLTRIRLVSTASEQANGSPPGEVEIYSALVPGRWYSLDNGVFQEEGPFSSLELVFPPTKARFVRLKIYSIRRGDDRLRLSGVQID
jgi:hypothetical protein